MWAVAGTRRGGCSEMPSMPAKRFVSSPRNSYHFVTAGRLLLLSGLEFPQEFPLWEGSG